ncbi:MAG: hypothetical protein EOP52_03055 [Sphingobacteriales bacterium]|nr:MAG: hypothetical protein EOP52_03055 [Sphingobacteriales bacterium]
MTSSQCRQRDASCIHYFIGVGVFQTVHIRCDTSHVRKRIQFPTVFDIKRPELGQADAGWPKNLKNLITTTIILEKKKVEKIK